MSPAPRPAIVATGVRKSFGEVVVLDGVDLTVAEGTVFALLGPNGAGKTTMIRILSTLVPPDAGELRVAGHDVVGDPDAVRGTIGLTGQFSAVDELLTGLENMRLMADLNHLGRAGRGRVDELLERFGLTDAAHRPVSTYSGGMHRRLDLAMTLVGSPRVVFLDEPTTGLDPGSRRTMWDSIRALVAERDHDLSHHAVPRRGRRARRPDRGPRPWSDRGRRHLGRAQTARPRRPCPPAAGRPERRAGGRTPPRRGRRRRGGPRGAGADRRHRRLAAATARTPRRRRCRGRAPFDPQPESR